MVALQFNGINEGGYIRTTPTASPRSSKSLAGHYRHARSERPSFQAHAAPAAPVAEVRPAMDYEGLQDGSATPTPVSPFTAAVKTSAVPEGKRRSIDLSRPPPILKTSSSGSSRYFEPSTPPLLSGREVQSRKLSRDVDTDVPDEYDDADVPEGDPVLASTKVPAIVRTGPIRRSTVTRFNEEVAVSIPKAAPSLSSSTADKPRRSSADTSGGQRTGKRNPIVVANAGFSRRRPTVLPRRSSGNSSLSASRSSSYSKLARSLKEASINFDDSSRRETEDLPTRRARAGSPHSSKDRRPRSPGPTSSEDEVDEDDSEGSDPVARTILDPNSNEETSSGAVGKPTRGSKPLVDPDFRSKFARNDLSSHRSLTSLPAFARKSSAAVPAAASFQASGMMETARVETLAGHSKGRESFTNVTAPLKAPASAGPETVLDDDFKALPKTKSQLTLLLERERARSANQESSTKRSEKR